MARCHAYLVLAAFLVVPAAGASVSPVQKVLSLIDDFVAKVQGELDATVKDFRAFSQFAEKDKTEKDYALKSSVKAIEALEATVSDSEAKIATYEEKIAELSTKISETQQELEKGIAQRAKENAAFLEEEKVLVADVESIRVATETVAASSSFAQLTPNARKAFDAITAGMREVAASSFVTHGKDAKVAAFLQARADAEDGMENVDGPLGDILAKVLEMAEEALSAAREKEQKA